MLLREAREAKLEALQGIEKLTIRPRLAFGSKGSRSKSDVALAVGIAPGSSSNAYKLAIRAAPGMEALTEQVVRRLTPATRRDLDLVEGIEFLPRRLSAGVSVGHFKITAGTLGGFVRDGRGTYILSNNHVLAANDVCQRGDDIWWPGPADIKASHSPYRVIAKLARWLPLNSSSVDNCDAAIAALEPQYLDKLRPRWYRGIGELNPKPVRNRFATKRVVKLGRTSGRTRGIVSAFELDGVQIDVGTRTKPRLIIYNDQLEFVHRFRTVAFSQGGDSGSFILDAKSRRPLALLHAGGVDQAGIDRTIGHFMGDVLQRLGVRIV